MTRLVTLHEGWAYAPELACFPLRRTQKENKSFASQEGHLIDNTCKLSQAPASGNGSKSVPEM